MPRPSWLAPQFEGEAQSLVGEGRRHADVDHRHVGRVLGDGAAQRARVADRAGDDEATVDQELDQAVAQDGRVLGDGDPECAGHHGDSGRSTVTTVGPPGGLTRCEPAVDGVHAVGQAGQAARRGAEPGELRPARAVVAHDEAQPGALLRAGDRWPARPGRAGPRWPAARPRRSRRWPRWPASAGRAGRPSTSVGHGAAGGQRGQRALQADVERRRVDAAGDVAQLGDGLLGAPVRLVDELADLVEVDVVARPPASPWPCPDAWPAPPAGPGCRRAGRARSAAAWRPRRRPSGCGPARASAPGPPSGRARAATPIMSRSTLTKPRMAQGAAKRKTTPRTKTPTLRRKPPPPVSRERCPGVNRFHARPNAGVPDPGEKKGWMRQTKRVPPEAERHEDAEQRPRHLEREVGHGAPGHPVAQATTAASRGIPPGRRRTRGLRSPSAGGPGPGRAAGRRRRGRSAARARGWRARRR